MHHGESEDNMQKPNQCKPHVMIGARDLDLGIGVDSAGFLSPLLQ
jgi:hypothetical protein